jgi:branched-chain amino acid aminotransferase
MLFFEGALDLNLDAYRPMVAVAAWEWRSTYRDDVSKHGFRLTISSISRQQPNASLSKAKINGLYTNAMLAKTMATRAGFDGAILLDNEGYVTGCTSENLLLVRDNVIYTPPGATTLEGITLNTVLTLAREAGYTILEESISREALYNADEVLVCSTATEVLAAAEIDHRKIGQGYQGPVTKQLQRLYYETTRGQTDRSTEWLDYMVMDPFV